MTETATALTDEITLIARAVAEPAAFTDIYDHYFPRVYTYIRYRIRHASEADDLAAQVFERALARLGDYRAESGPFPAWLFAIARNAISDHRRSHRRRWGFLLGISHDRPDDERPPDEAMIRDERQAALIAAIARLSERERDLIGLRFAGGLGNKTIAQLTGLSESNVAVILFRALRRLRADLSRTR